MKLFQSLLIFILVGVVIGEFFILLREEKAPVLPYRFFYMQDNITIESIDHQDRNKTENKSFSKYEGDVFNLNKHNNFSVLEFFQPFSRGRGIAGGDFNNDGWQDILLGTNKGVILYRNIGGRFVLQNINLVNVPSLDLGVYVAAFVDIDNDGWQDIYLTTYGGNNFFLLNDKKSFKNPKVLEAPNTGAVLTTAVSFGDLDKDGWLDFVNGNWYLYPTEVGAETNKLIRNNALQYIEEDLQEFRGQALSVLLSDFTNNNNLDLITGDEFEAPDNFHWGDGEGGFHAIKKADGVIPASAHFNMSIDVADFNNDLYMDIYVSGVSTYKIFTENPCPNIQNNEERQKCEKNIETMDIVREGSIEQCAGLTEQRDKNECATIVLLRLSGSRQDKTLCDKIPQEYILQRLACKGDFTRKPSFSVQDQGALKEAILQLPWQNVLLQGSPDGVFQEASKEKKVASAFNSWNAKFADLDNDEWQDIYVATGELIHWGNVFQPNVFFHNYEGQYFKQEQEEFGLEGVGITPSYTYIDIDNDGDLDIMSVPINEPLKIYINNETQNNSVTFEFRDYKGNHFGIGNKIYIYYGENNERHQVREIKSGGGFLSFDPLIAHFGLGQYNRVNRVEVVWSTGERTIIDKEFLANKNYVITRKK